MNPHLRLAGVLGACALAVASAPPSGWAATKAARPRGVNARTGRATPPFSELVRASRKNDRAALERLAGRFGVARLGEGARGANAAVAQAALATMPFARGGVLLAGVVAERLSASEPTLAVAAARALGALFEGDVPGALAEWEVPADVVTRACGGLRALAARADAPAPSAPRGARRARRRADDLHGDARARRCCCVIPRPRCVAPPRCSCRRGGPARHGGAAATASPIPIRP